MNKTSTAALMTLLGLGASHATNFPNPNASLKPFREEMKKWGKRKRKRFVELMEMGYNKEVAFNAVENNQGEVDDGI
jgi:hypothetical protein